CRRDRYLGATCCRTGSWCLFPKPRDSRARSTANHRDITVSWSNCFPSLPGFQEINSSIRTATPGLEVRSGSSIVLSWLKTTWPNALRRDVPNRGDMDATPKSTSRLLRPVSWADNFTPRIASSCTRFSSYTRYFWNAFASMTHSFTPYSAVYVKIASVKYFVDGAFCVNTFSTYRRAFTRSTLRIVIAVTPDIAGSMPAIVYMPSEPCTRAPPTRRGPAFRRFTSEPYTHSRWNVLSDDESSCWYRNAHRSAEIAARISASFFPSNAGYRPSSPGFDSVSSGSYG